MHRPGRIPWRAAWELQKELASRAAVSRGTAHLVLVEHPPVFTLGRHARTGSLLAPREELARRGIQVEPCDRGGDVTWHGPGQVVGYPILHLPTFRLGVAAFVHGLEAAMSRACAVFGVAAAAGGPAIGAWVDGRKIGSIGIHVSRGVTTHGFALNACPDLSHFQLIHPCGMPGCPMTTIEREAGRPVTWEAAADAMEREIAALLRPAAVERATTNPSPAGGAPRR